MKKLMLSLFIALTIASISNAKTREPLLDSCHVLKRFRAAIIKKLQELDTEAAEGDIASAASLLVMSGFCSGRKFHVWGKTEEKLKELGFIDNDGDESTLFCKCLSEEVYQECKDVFEADNKTDSIQK